MIFEKKVAMCSFIVKRLKLCPLAPSLLGLAFSLGFTVSSSAGTLTTLYSFTGGADGSHPAAGVVADGNGVLYGQTENGGNVACKPVGGPQSVCGTIYSFNPATGVLTTLVNFTGPNGAYGVSTPTLVGNTLYGAANLGGSAGYGTLFSVHTDGSSFKLLHNFTGPDGKHPVDALRMGPDGTLYGVTSDGGASDFGVLYSIKPDGTFAVVHSFAGGASDGHDPSNVLISKAGLLVGNTHKGGTSTKGCTGGCGTLFTYNIPTGRYSVPFFFPGAGIYGGFVGAFGKGNTVYGNDYAPPYSINQATGLVSLGCFGCSFAGAVGSGPLLMPDGSVIGVEGDSPVTSGMLYQASNGVIDTLAFFGSNGANPLAQPIALKSGQIIGTADEGGLCTYCGTIWEYTP